MTLEHLARKIARAGYGTDAHWVAMMPAARAARREVVEACIEECTAENVRLGHTWLKRRLRAFIVSPDSTP